ncbi:MAG: glycosyltransferase family 4 protein [Bacteroidales bacterium]
MTAGKKRVVIVGSAYPLRGGGIATFNERLARAFQENGDAVTIYSFSLQYPAFLFPGTSQYTDEPPPEGLDIVTKVNSVNPLNWFLVGREISRLKPDLVVMRFWIPFMGPSLGTIGRILRKKGIKVIAITDNIIPHEPSVFDNFLVSWFVKSVDGFVTMSKSVLNDLQKFDDKKPRKLTVHPLYDNFGEPVPMEQAREKLGLPQSGKIILFFGFIREYKGLDLLLQAMADDRLKMMDIRLLIAGEFYTSEEPYKKLIQELNLTDRVILHTHFIPNSDIVNYFCSANLVAQPYKSATQSGITQVAYHFNKPMITTNVGGLAEIVPDGKVGFVVQPESSRIADAIYRYFSNDLEKDFTTNISIEKKRFSWQTMLDAIEHVAFSEKN